MDRRVGLLMAGRIYYLEQTAKVRYPEKDWMWHKRYAKMYSRILGWEKTYSDYQADYGFDVVLLFVNEEDHTTRSPAKKQAIKDWRYESGLVQEAPASATEDSVD
jgi:hypothetical protein